MNTDPQLDHHSARLMLRNATGEVVGYAVIDADRADDLGRWRWMLHPNGGAMRTKRIPGVGPRHVQLAREVLGLPFGNGRRSIVRHLNGDRLDNRRANLTIAPCSLVRMLEERPELAVALTHLVLGAAA